MAEAAAVAWPDWVVNAISNLRVLNGIKLEQGDIEVEIVALASSHGDASGFEATMTLRPPGEKTVPYYRASVHLGNSALESEPYNSTLKPGAAPVDVLHAYRKWLFHGPNFQTMTSFIGVDEKGAIVTIQPSDPREWLPDTMADDGWLFDPGIVDSGPQMALVWAQVIRSASALPSRFGKVSRFGTQPIGRCRMYFNVHPDQSENQVKADVAFVDENNQLRLLMEEMECTSSPALARLGGGWKGEICVGSNIVPIIPDEPSSPAPQKISN